MRQYADTEDRDYPRRRPVGAQNVRRIPSPGLHPRRGFHPGLYSVAPLVLGWIINQLNDPNSTDAIPKKRKILLSFPLPQDKLNMVTATFLYSFFPKTVEEPGNDVLIRSL